MGVAHHSVYPIWFEVGRTEFIRGYGMPYGRLESEGMYLPMIGLTCEYKGFSKYEDMLEIRTRIAELTKTRLNFYYEVIKDGRVIATGTTSHIFANRELRPVNLSRHMPDAYGLFRRLAGYEE